MENFSKKTNLDAMRAIACVGVSAAKIKDAQRLLALIANDFFGEYDETTEEGRYLIAYHYPFFASYARILGVCLNDIADNLTEADDVLSEIGPADFQHAVLNDSSDGDENG
ncbi:MAG: hypothetical protein IJI39_02420 [Clostridia bacterium]|nr:hypothetical protein [Clostridia bacterium]MBQ6529761.1 hypothetical protein [Clostridia bacterium]